MTVQHHNISINHRSSEVQVSLNMSDVIEEDAEHGDGDSVADAI
jgi:hypothetical protein